MSLNSDIETLLKMRTVAVVGCSPKPVRPSNRIARYLMEAGYRVFPVNPGHARVLDQRCYENLSEIEEKIDLVNVFRKSEYVAAIVEEAIAAGAKGIWLQDGVTDPAAETRARESGLTVVSDDCIMRQHLSRFR